MKSWSPVLPVPEAQRALALARQIAADIARAGSAPDASLADGDSGIALLFSELERVEPGLGHRELAEAYLERALTALGDQPLGPGLHEGFAGVGFALQQVMGGPRGGSASTVVEDESFAELDEAVLLAIRGQTPRIPTGLYAGLAGLAVYLLERLPSPGARAGLEQLLAAIGDRAELQGGSCCWLTLPGEVWPSFRNIYQAGYYELGVARGVAGILGVLAAARRSLAMTELDALIEGAVLWLLSKQRPSGQSSRFGFYVLPDGSVESRDSKASWCMGDPGIAVSLWAAGDVLQRPQWQALAVDMALQAAARPTETTGLVDAGFCHGYAGLGHVLNRLYHGSGDARLATAARLWFERVLAAADLAQDLGGYRFYRGGWQALRGLTSGAAGVALTLIAASTTSDPGWDRVFLPS
jgi:lantibiotic biosynthesis protein